MGIYQYNGRVGITNWLRTHRSRLARPGSSTGTTDWIDHYSIFISDTLTISDDITLLCMWAYEPIESLFGNMRIEFLLWQWCFWSLVIVCWCFITSAYARRLNWIHTLSIICIGWSASIFYSWFVCRLNFKFCFLFMFGFLCGAVVKFNS